ncbi:MAG: inverse autotransporter beta domain-containing protein [Gemmataceae bacterium]
MKNVDYLVCRFKNLLPTTPAVNAARFACRVKGRALIRVRPVSKRGGGVMKVRMVAWCLLTVILLAPGTLQAQTIIDPLLLSPQGYTDFDVDRLYLPRAGYLYQTGPGIGYNTSFSSFDAFVPYPGGDGSSISFADLRLLLNNAGAVGANLGGGYRTFNSAATRIFGANFYYDNRDTGIFTFSQVGGGVECLSDLFDFRSNFYIPVGPDRKSYGFNYCDPRYLPRFQDNFILLTRADYQQLAMNSFDMEVGVPLPVAGGGDPRAYVGYYYLESKGRDASGVYGRLEVLPWRNLSMNLQVSNDTVFDTTVIFNVALHAPSLRQARRGRRSLQERLNQPVHRNQNILVADHVKTSYEKALDPTTGAPIIVTHFNSNAAAGGDGTVQRPFNMLPNGTVPGNILFAHADSVFNNQFINLTNGQRFLGEGKTHFFTSLQSGTCLLPRATNGINLPVIANSPVDAITLASNTEVTGFVINSPGRFGITGTGIQNVLINCNTITNSGADAIFLTNVGGSNTIVMNTLLNSGDDAIDINADGNNTGRFNITGNTIINPGDDGIDFDISDNAVVTASLSNNLVNGPADRAVSLLAEDASTLNVTASNNQFLNTINEGIAAIVDDQSVLSLTAVNNLFQNIGDDGIFASADDTTTLNITANNNTFLNTDDEGIDVLAFGNSNVNVTTNNNVFNGIGGNGIDANAFDDATINWSATGNSFQNIAFNGVDAFATDDSVINFNVANNTFNGVGNDGVNVITAVDATVNFTITGNTFQNINDDGVGAILTGNSQSTFLISGNTFTAIDDSAIGSLQLGNATATFRVLNNTVSNTGGDSFDFVTTLGDATLNVQIVGNTFQVTGVDAINIDVDDQTVCAQIFQNTSNADFTLSNDDGNVMLEDTPANGGDPTFGNTFLGGAGFNLSGVTIVPVGTCGFPTP